MFDCKIHVDSFSKVSYISTNNGYIVWRKGTGGNMELLHIRTHKPRMGYGTRLFYLMLEALKVDPPYCTVFGFTRASNVSAQAFYRSMGFVLSEVNGVYKDGSAVLFSQTYDILVHQQQQREQDANSQTTS